MPITLFGSDAFSPAQRNELPTIEAALTYLFEPPRRHRKCEFKDEFVWLGRRLTALTATPLTDRQEGPASRFRMPTGRPSSPSA
jgi:hypothetical protein